MRNSRARPGTGTFLSADGTGDERLFANNDLSDAARGAAGDVDFATHGNVGPR